MHRLPSPSPLQNLERRLNKSLLHPQVQLELEDARHQRAVQLQPHHQRDRWQSGSLQTSPASVKSGSRVRPRVAKQHGQGKPGGNQHNGQSQRFQPNNPVQTAGFVESLVQTAVDSSSGLPAKALRFLSLLYSSATGLGRLLAELDPVLAGLLAHRDAGLLPARSG